MKHPHYTLILDLPTIWKVWNASMSTERSRSDAPRSPGSNDEPEESSLADFKKNLTHAKQPYPIATVHVWLAYLGLGLTLLISIPTLGLLASMILW